MTARLARIRPWLEVAVIVGLAVWTFWPALFVPPRSDQLVFLYLTDKYPSLGALLKAAYSLQREEMQHDFVLYRPVLFWMLALGRWICDLDPVKWQALALSAHVVTAVTLWHSLRRYVSHTSWLPFLLAAFFVANLCSYEMATWHHIFAYSLGVAAVLAALGFSAQYIHAGKTKSLIAAAVCLLFAAFDYETFALGSLLVGSAGFVFSSIRRDRRKRLLFGLTLFIGLSAFVSNFADFYFRFGMLPKSGGYANNISLEVLVNGSLESVATWARMAFTPTTAILEPFSRLRLTGWKSPFEGAGLLQIGFAGLLFSVLIATIAKAVRAKFLNISKFEMWNLVVCASLASLFLGTLVAGRMAERGVQSVLEMNVYYPYFPLAFLLAGVGPVISRILQTESTRTVKLLISSVVGLTIFHSFASHELASYSRDLHSGQMQIIESIRDTVRQHESEPDFSFSLGPSCESIHFRFYWIFARPTGVENRQFSIAETLYPRFYKPEGGKYVVLCH